MNSPAKHTLSRFLVVISENAWFAYLTIILLQIKVMLGIWQYRDLAPGDTSYYYMGVFSWLNETQVNIISAPLYTIFLASLHSLFENPFQVLVIAQVSIALGASTLVLALLRRLLPQYMAWLIAAWWVLLPVNFDTAYSVHLFAALFPLGIFVIAASIRNCYGRGLVLGGFLLAAVLVRVEYGSLFILWLLVIGGYEFIVYRRRRLSPTFNKLLLAYGLPLLAVLLVIGAFTTQYTNKFDTEQHLERKNTLTFCQVYAYSMKDQGDPWRGNPFTECQDLVERDFGRPAVTFSQAFFLNPSAMLKLTWWNFKLIPSATQLALFNYYGGSTNPDALPARHSSKVWLPFLLVLGFSALGAITYFGKPCLQRQYHTIANRFTWLLLLSAALMVLGILVLIRPQPAYMFPYSLSLMALTGLGLHASIERLKLRTPMKTLLPIVAILLILLLPSYYNADYINHFGYGGQPLRQNYDRIAPQIKKASLPLPAVLFTPIYAYDEALCNYLGLLCLALDMENNFSPEKMNDLVSAYDENIAVENFYVLYHEDMIWEISSLNHKKNNYSADYVELRCTAPVNSIMTCSDGLIDLNRGLMSNGVTDIPLRAALFVNDGYVIDRQDFRADEGYYLQVLMQKNKIALITVADERLFWTSFNQQYLLGNLDRRYFEEVYNNSPVARILKVKNTGKHEKTQ